MVQVPNLALTHRKRIKVYKNKQQLLFRVVTPALWDSLFWSSTVKLVFVVVDTVAADVDNFKAAAAAKICQIAYEKKTGFELL